MRAIMGRALQIDSGRSERFTPEQIRTIAGELGISTQALEVAMYEADSKGGVVNTQSQPATPPRRLGRTIAFAVGVLLVMAAGFAFLRMAAPTREPVIDRVAQPARAIPTPVPVEPVSPSPSPVPKKTTRKTPSPP